MHRKTCTCARSQVKINGAEAGGGSKRMLEKLFMCIRKEENTAILKVTNDWDTLANHKPSLLVPSFMFSLIHI